MAIDPRPRTTPHDNGARVTGVRCTACAYPAAFARVRCPRCGSEVTPAMFGPGGVVWASTVVRVPVPGRTPPYGLAYVDLDDGPRVLAHVLADDDVHTPAPVGARVRLVDRTRDDDLQVELTP